MRSFGLSTLGGVVTLAVLGTAPSARLPAAFAQGVAPIAAQDDRGAVVVAALLARVGARIERYLERAQSLVCDERVLILSQGNSMRAGEWAGRADVA